MKSVYRIIDNIERKKVIIYELDTTTLKQTAGVMIEVNYINYMVDKKDEMLGHLIKFRQLKERNFFHSFYFGL